MRISITVTDLRRQNAFQSDVFIWRDSQKAEHLLAVNPTVGEKIREILRNTTCSIKRRTGGLTTGCVEQLVFCFEVGELARVKAVVKFKDLLFDSTQLLQDRWVSRQKVVSLTDIEGPAPYDFSGSQSYVVDFGGGAVPIVIVHVEGDNSHTQIVYFVEIEAMERALRESPDRKVPLQVYSVPCNALRWAPDLGRSEQPTDYESAWENYERLRSHGFVIPPHLAVHPGIEVEGGGSMLGTRRLIKEILFQSLHPKEESGYRNFIAPF